MPDGVVRVTVDFVSCRGILYVIERPQPRVHDYRHVSFRFLTADTGRKTFGDPYVVVVVVVRVVAAYYSRFTDECCRLECEDDT